MAKWTQRDLSYLQREEFRIQGGQIGDQGSYISYNCVCNQIEEGVKEHLVMQTLYRVAGFMVRWHKIIYNKPYQTLDMFISIILYFIIVNYGH